jgi:transcriptional regulator with XRE-family HTH domain
MNIIAVIRRAAQEAGSQKALAERLGLSESHVSDVLNGRKDPAEGILEPLGYERVVTYRRKRSNGSPAVAQ